MDAKCCLLLRLTKGPTGSPLRRLKLLFRLISFLLTCDVLFCKSSFNLFDKLFIVLIVILYFIPLENVLHFLISYS